MTTGTQIKLTAFLPHGRSLEETHRALEVLGRVKLDLASEGIVDIDLSTKVIHRARAKVVPAVVVDEAAE